MRNWITIHLITCVIGKISMDEIDIFGNVKELTGYGTEWIFFPDGDGIPHFVNLSMPNMFPMTRSEKGKMLEYRFYARNLYDYILLDQSAKPVDDIKISEIISNKEIKLVTHGWMSSAEKSVIRDIKNAYLKAQDVIVIGVDWSDTAMDLFYPTVASETGSVGTQLGQFLNAFSELYNVSGERLHLIGHSLGAHVTGIAASSSNLTVGRITGLDPARPLFEFPKRPASLSLDATDAVFVDIIHSCGGILGVHDSIGHADFYPNSGAAPQPGCDSIFFLLEACSHSRSHIYFSESIDNPTGFPACRSENWSQFVSSNECSDQIYMGDNVDRRASGEYFLKTNSQKPFGRSTR